MGKIRYRFIVASIMVVTTTICIQCRQNASADATDTKVDTSKLQIAYTTLVDGNSDYDVFIMDLDGSNQRNITNRPGVDWVYWSEGDMLYFASDRDTCARCYFLYEMNAMGQNVRKIFEQRIYDSYFSTRNDGGEILVTTRDPGGLKTVRIINSNGSVLQTLIDQSDQDENDAAFSPNGKEIVFRSRESGHDELWIMNIESGAKRQVTYYPEGDTSIAQHGYHAGPPRWERNRNIITYTSNQNGSYSIYSINPDGTGKRRVTPAQGAQVYHGWSPDGSLLAFDGAIDNASQFDIYLMNMSDESITKLTDNKEWEQGPVFVRAQ